MKKLTIALLSGLLFSSPLHSEEKPAEKDYVILKVGGDEIKKSEVNEILKGIFPGGNAPTFETLPENIRDNVLRGIASERVIQKEAEKSGIQNSEAVKSHIAVAERQIVIQEFLKVKTKDLVSDDKLKAAYEERMKAQGGAQEEVRARHILVKTEEEAKDIAKKLKKGADFEKLAKEKSEDKGSGTAGGDLGYFTADKMVPEFSKAAFAMKKGEISAPVKSDFGWHIIKVEDRRKSTPPAFDQMKESLRQEAGNKAVSDYVNDLMKDTKVTVFDAKGESKELPATPASGAADSPAKR